MELQEGKQNREQSYVSRLLTNYVEAIKTIRAMPPQAQDFIAAHARKIVFFEEKLRQAGYEPVFLGTHWELKEIKK